MRSKQKRRTLCKDAEKNQRQTHEVMEMSSVSGSSDTDTAFDSCLTSFKIKQKASNIVSNFTDLAPVPLGRKQTFKSSNSRARIKEVDSFTICHLSDQLNVKLNEIQVYNPTFPVKNIFRKLHKKSFQKVFTTTVQNNKANYNQDNQRSSDDDDDEDATTAVFTPSRVVQGSTVSTPEKFHRTNRLSRTRRLKPGRVTLDEQQTKETQSDQQSTSAALPPREPFSEDALWTDKYCPGDSSEVIGNIDAVEKLHSWLRKWKLKSDVERTTEKQSNDFWDCGDFEDETGTEDGTEERLCNTVLISGPAGAGKTASVYACAAELCFKVFEVNCSSQRSGNEVLSQLKEATQSHLVEIPGKDRLKPAFFNNYHTVRSSSSKSDPLPVKTPKMATVSTFKNKSVKNRSDCKESTKPITLTSYFKTKAKADYLYHRGVSTTCTNPATIKDCKGATSKKMADSLILFEEVDIIFEDDVGFLAAVKAFMRTSKRPVVLTTSDPLFREKFNSYLDEIIFQTPSMTDLCSYLQLVCLAEDVPLDLQDVRTLCTATRGDVRRCLLQLQLWANSGAGHGNEGNFTYKGCSANMLGLHFVNKNNLLELLEPTSWTKQQMDELLQPLTESWRNGFPLLYSNLELLLHVDANKADNTCSESKGKTLLCDTKEMENASGQCSTRPDVKTTSRLSRKKNKLSPLSFSPTRLSEKPQCAGDELETTSRLTALSGFFDAMSFIDARVPAVQQLVATPCNLQEFVWTGSKMQDGLLDETKGEEDKSKEMMLDIRATVEALGFHQCRKQVSDTRDVHRSRPEDFNTQDVNLITSHHLDLHVVSQRLNISKKILSSRYFSLLHNKRAVCIDYLPIIRFICRTHRKWIKCQAEDKPKSMKAFRTQLRLTKEDVQILAQEFS